MANFELANSSAGLKSQTADSHHGSPRARAAATMPRGRSRGKVASVLPKSVAVASTEGDLASVTEWLKSKPDLEAKAVVEISVGDEVKEGDALIVVEAMKMEHTIVAPTDGKVSDIFFAVDDQVEDGEELLSLDSDLD